MPQAKEPVSSSHWKASTAQAPMKDWVGAKNRSRGLAEADSFTEPARPLPAIVIHDT